MGNMNLVTGYIGSNHVTAADAGSFHAAIFGDGQYLLNRGQKLAATVVSNNQLRIGDGDLIMQGRHIRINEGDVIDLTIENGATDYNRNDLVAARYTKDASTGVESVDLVVIKGTAVTGTAEDPAYTIGDIISGDATLNEMPLYRLQIVGLSIAAVTPLYEEASNLQGIVMKSCAVSLPTSGWSGLKQTVTVSKVTDDSIIVVAAAPESYEAYVEALVRCSGQAENSLTFTAAELPTTDLVVNVLVMK